MKTKQITALGRYVVIGSLAAASLTFAQAASANRLDDIKSKGTLVCGTQNASTPYGFQDPATRQYAGYDVDICQAVARQLGVKLEHKPLSTEARIPEVKMGRVDMVAGSVAWLPKRAQEVDFSYQYLEGHIKVLVNKDSGISSLSGLAGKKVCASSGSSSAAIAKEVLKDSEVLTYQNISQCYLGLQNDKVIGMTAGELVLKRFLNESQNSDRPTVLIEEPTYTEKIGIIFQKGQPELVEAVNQALVALDQSGELTTIYNKWMGPESDYNLTRHFTVGPIESGIN